MKKISKKQIESWSKVNSTKNKGIYLDVGCGNNKQPNFIGIDKRKLPNVDIVHDLEVLPYPLPNNICLSILASHIVEHLKPWLFVDIMNEWWRIMRPNGRLLISTPYANSFGYWQDPTHCNGCNEATWAYFDPTHRSNLYRIYTPQPWKIVDNVWSSNGNMEVILEKIPLEDFKVIDGQKVLDAKWFGGSK